MIKAFINRVVSEFVRADRVIKGLTAQRDEARMERDDAIARCKANEDLVAALQAENEAEAQAAQEALDAIAALELPEIPDDAMTGIDENVEENEQQFEDTIPELAIETPEVDFDQSDAPTAGTPDETPSDVVDAAVEAVVEAVEGETETEEDGMIA